LVRDYLNRESLDKRGIGFNTESWEERAPSVALQLNDKDCGVYVCTFAKCLALGIPLPQHLKLSQVNTLRYRIASEIENKRLRLCL
jgi:Ulp1 family protease